MALHVVLFKCQGLDCRSYAKGLTTLICTLRPTCRLAEGLPGKCLQVRDCVLCRGGAFAKLGPGLKASPHLNGRRPYGRRVGQALQGSHHPICRSHVYSRCQWRSAVRVSGTHCSDSYALDTTVSRSRCQPSCCRYDNGITGGVVAMDGFLKRFFPGIFLAVLLNKLQV